MWGFHEMLAELFGHPVYRLAAVRGSEWVGLLPLVYQRSVLGRFLTSVPYLNYAGVLAEDVRARAALSEAAARLARRLRAHRLELRGRDGSDLPLETWTGKCTYTLEMPREAQTLWKGLGAKVRAQVKRPRKEGFTAHVLDADGRAKFYPVLARRWHQLGSPVLPRAFFARMESVFGRDLRYVSVERDGEVAAVGALVRFGGTLQIPWAASRSSLNRFGVNMLLYWTALEHAVAIGARVFDFGRSTPGSGNTRFKLQWGATERPLIWNVVVANSRGRAGERGDKRRDLMAQAWSRLPGFVASTLGPRLAARIPY